MTIRFAGDDADGLALMLARLLEANVERRPRRRWLARSASVTIEAPDAGVAVALRFGAGRAIVGGALDPRPDVHVCADAHDLLFLPSTPLRLGFPDPFTRAGRVMLRLVLTRRVRIRGMMRHPIVTSRLARLLSAL